MKFYDATLIIILTIVVAGVVIAGCNYYLPEIYPDDNPIEEAIEKKIQDETGFDVDLSPDSPESSKHDNKLALQRKFDRLRKLGWKY